MIDKIIQGITGLTLNQWLAIGLGIICLAIIGYVISLKNDISSLKLEILQRESDISTLQIAILNQNSSVELAAQAKIETERRIKNVEISNGRLQKKLDQAKIDIEKQPVPTDSDQAIEQISNNAESIAKDWNSK